MPIAEFDMSQGLMLAGVALLVFMLMRRHRHYQSRVRRDARRDRREKKAKTANESFVTRTDQPLMGAPDSILQWHVEMHETAREMQGQLDSKMRSLQVLIAQANQVMAELKQARGDLPVKHKVDPLPPEWDKSKATLPMDKKRGEIYSLADDGNTAADIASRIGLPIGEIELILSLRS